MVPEAQTLVVDAAACVVSGVCRGLQPTHFVAAGGKTVAVATELLAREDADDLVVLCPAEAIRYESPKGLGA